jgi:hypothetical protein
VSADTDPFILVDVVFLGDPVEHEILPVFLHRVPAA